MTKITLIDLPYVSELAALYPYFRDLPYPALLDSNQSHFPDCQYDILTADPECYVSVTRSIEKTQENTFSWQARWKNEPIYQVDKAENAFDFLQQLMQNACKEKWAQSASESLPFTGGLLGYFGYESGQLLETLPSTAQQDISLPDLSVGLYGWALISLHQEQKTVLMLTPWCDAQSKEQLEARCHNAIASESDKKRQSESSNPFMLTQLFQSNMTAADYADKFAQVQRYIRAGDCYQVNLAQRFSSTYSGDTFMAYQHLRKSCPTPFSAYLEIEKDALTTDDRSSVLSHSPERFLSVNFTRENYGVVETKPIKGTRARGKTKQEDQQLADELLASPKDKAENLMIVDLLRNDLGKTCDVGSVKVPKLFALETYANVHHLVSTVTASIQSKEKHIEVFRNSFPGGSITGAPKIRAMEIIDELEPHERSVYCGSIAYFSVNGQMDSSITIRTLVANNQQLHCWAGGGLVIDSKQQDEYEETFTKVRNLTQSLERAFLLK